MENIEQSVISSIVSQLKAANLPITDENIEEIVGAMDMSSSLFELSESAERYLLQDGSSFTPENIYQSVYSSTNAGFNKQEGFDEISAQAQTVVESSGLEVNDVNMDKAKWIYENRLPLTPETLNNYDYLKTLEDELDEGEVISQLIDGIKDRIPAASVPLTTISDHRKLEETRLRMFLNTETSFNTEERAEATKQLIEYVDFLKAKERDLYSMYFEDQGSETVEATKKEEQASLLKQSLTVVKTIQEAPAEVRGGTYGDKGMANRLDEVYEKVMTEVRPDLGDNIKKAFSNIDQLLTELDLPATSINAKSVRILAYNQMDITKENVQMIKQYDLKVSHLMEQMKPEVTAELIKQNKNPLTMTLDELSQTISGFDELLNRKSEDSAAKFLWRMDKTDGLTSEERDSFVGIYRLLNQVKQSDGAAIGAVINSGRELSMESLLSSVRSAKKGHMDYAVDDDFGSLEDVVTQGKDIEKQINSAFSYETATVDTVIGRLTPERLKELAQNNDIMSMPLEELANQLSETNVEEPSKDAYYDQQLAHVNDVMNDYDESSEFLDEYGMEKTIGFLAQASKHLKGKGIFADVNNETNYEEEINDIVEQFDDDEGREQAYLSLEQKVQSESVMMNNQLSMFYGSLRKQQRYEVPILTSQGLTMLNVTIANENKPGSTVNISYQSPTYGAVSAEFTIKGLTVDGFVVSESNEAKTSMQSVVEQMSVKLNDDEMTVGTINYATGHRVSGKTEHGQDATTKQLYKVAKAFIQGIKSCEEVYHEN